MAVADADFEGYVSECVLEAAGAFCCIFDDLEIATGPCRLVDEYPKRWVGTPIGADMSSGLSSILHRNGAVRHRISSREPQLRSMRK
jgi:hypothetical protein